MSAQDPFLRVDATTSHRRDRPGSSPRAHGPASPLPVTPTFTEMTGAANRRSSRSVDKWRRSGRYPSRLGGVVVSVSTFPLAFGPAGVSVPVPRMESIS
jgi:hypothetical protein